MNLSRNFLLVVAILGTNVFAGDLTQEEREQAAAALREYQAMFSENQVNVEVRAGARMLKSRNLGRDFTLTVAGDRMHTLARAENFLSAPDDPEDGATETTFNLTEGHGFEVMYRKDGSILQVARCPSDLGGSNDSGVG
jgi:hypothetical protein